MEGSSTGKQPGFKKDTKVVQVIMRSNQGKDKNGAEAGGGKTWDSS